MKTLQYLQKLFSGFFILIIAMSVLTWLGFINPFDTFESSMSDRVESKLRIEAASGKPDSQNKLGTLLYVAAKKTQGDFSEAISWFEKAGRQDHPIAQMNLAFSYKAGNGVLQNNQKAIELFHSAGLLFLKREFPMDAKDCVHAIAKINSVHPLKTSLIQAITRYEEHL